MLSFITERQSCWEKLQAETRPIFIYGMGDGAEKIMRVFQEKKIPLAGIFASDDFVRCHTSFLVNFSYVKECTKKKMLLENGKIVDISRSYWKKTEEAYVEWMKRWAM